VQLREKWPLIRIRTYKTKAGLELRLSLRSTRKDFEKEAVDRNRSEPERAKAKLRVNAFRSALRALDAQDEIDMFVEESLVNRTMSEVPERIDVLSSWAGFAPGMHRAMVEIMDPAQPSRRNVALPDCSRPTAEASGSRRTVEASGSRRTTYRSVHQDDAEPSRSRRTAEASGS